MADKDRPLSKKEEKEEKKKERDRLKAIRIAEKAVEDAEKAKKRQEKEQLADKKRTAEAAAAAAAYPNETPENANVLYAKKNHRESVANSRALRKAAGPDAPVKKTRAKHIKNETPEQRRARYYGYEKRSRIKMMEKPQGESPSGSSSALAPPPAQGKLSRKISGLSVSSSVERAKKHFKPESSSLSRVFGNDAQHAATAGLSPNSARQSSESLPDYDFDAGSTRSNSLPLRPASRPVSHASQQSFRFPSPGTDIYGVSAQNSRQVSPASIESQGQQPPALTRPSPQPPGGQHPPGIRRGAHDVALARTPTPPKR